MLRINPLLMAINAQKLISSACLHVGVRPIARRYRSSGTGVVDDAVQGSSRASRWASRKAQFIAAAEKAVIACQYLAPDFVGWVRGEPEDTDFGWVARQIPRQR
jgi:hypothetical protein